MANQDTAIKNQPISSSTTPKTDVVVVMVPFPAQSHLNQLLQFSHIISSYSIKVHYVASELHLSQVKSRATDQNPNPYIEFHSFPTPDFPSPPPDNPHYPSHLIPCFEASVELRHPVKNFLASLSETTERLVIIHDPLMSYVVQDSASLRNAEAYVFHCVSSLSNFVFYRHFLGIKIMEDIPYFEGALYPEFQGFVDRQSKAMFENKKFGSLHNTCRVIEGEFLNFLWEKGRETNEDMKQWAFGPLETVTAFKNKPTSRTRSGNYCLEWLDKQEPNSVLYVSFGTTTFLTDDQILELAIGLEQSGIKFLWVLRDADKANIFDKSEIRRLQLPRGFEERTEGMGIVVREWAPQLEILGHSSTGGFMSHCGWNSCLESLSLGVPLATWPMHSDQPMNAFLVAQILKAGLVVREWDKKDERVSSSVVADVVKRLMSSSQGNEIRKRAQKLGCELRKCSEEGGVSSLELNSFIAHITT